jgi:hypothetical protein
MQSRAGRSYGYSDSSFADHAAHLRKLAGSLPRTSCVKPVVMALSHGRPPAAEQVEMLRAAATGRAEGRSREKAAALWTLVYAGLLTDVPRAHADVLRAVMRNRESTMGWRVASRIRRAVTSAAIAGGLLATVVAMASALQHLGCGEDSLCQGGLIAANIFLSLAAVLLAAGCLAAPLALAVADWTAQTNVRADAAAALSLVAGPDDVDVLAAACFDVSSPVLLLAQYTLKGVLPALDESHRDILTVTTTPSLCRLLRLYDLELVCLTLDALGRVGDGRAAGHVELLLTENKGARVREAAERVLPVLQERRRREGDAASLVRPSSHQSAEECLLRPTRPGLHGLEEILPRPVEVGPSSSLDRRR